MKVYIGNAETKEKMCVPDAEYIVVCEPLNSPLAIIESNETGKGISITTKDEIDLLKDRLRERGFKIENCFVNVKYRALKSGAVNWLSDRDWKQLEEAGWKVHWISKDPDYQKLHEEGKVLIVEGRLHGSLANEAEKCFSSIGEAMREFQKITGLSVTEEGCDHCGPPHIFEWLEFHASGKECQEYLDLGEPN